MEGMEGMGCAASAHSYATPPAYQSSINAVRTDCSCDSALTAAFFFLLLLLASPPLTHFSGQFQKTKKVIPIFEC
jgi:hypothetical protein